MSRSLRAALPVALWLATVAPARAADLEPVGAELQVNSYGTGLQTLPKVAVGPGGEFVVVWQDGILGLSGQDGDDGGIQGRRFDADGDPIGDEIPINLQTVRSQEAPELAWTASDEILVVWSGWDQLGDEPETTSRGVRARRLAPSADPIGGEFTVNAYTEGSQQDPAVATGPDGATVVAWWDRSGLDGDGNGIRARRFDSAGGGEGTEFTVNSFTTGSQFGPGVAVGPDGAFVVVWSGSGTGAEPGVHSRRFLADGAPYGGQRRVSQAEADMQRDATIAAEGGGRFLVAWYDLPESRIRGRLLESNGVPIGSTFTVDTGDDPFARLPQIAAGANADFLVTWEAGTGTASLDSFRVRGRRLSSDGFLLGTELTLSSITSRGQWRSTPAALPDGDFLVTWEDHSPNDGSPPGIRARRFGVPEPVFADDFELGDGCAWDADFPGGLC